MKKIKVITVLRSNNDWIPEYVYNFKKGLDKNLTIPYEFICLTNIEIPNIQCLTLSDIGQGFWSKINLFRKDLDLSGPCLYFDLDTIIKGNIDSLVNSFFKYNFLMLRDPWKPPQSASGILWWQGDYSFLWDEFLRRPEKEWQLMYKNHPRFGDQGFIIDRVPEHRQIQEVIENPLWISRVTKKESEPDTKIVVFAGPNRKPWLNLTHPDVINHWI